MNKMEEPMNEVLLSLVPEACIRIRRLDLLSIMMKRRTISKGFGLCGPR